MLEVVVVSGAMVRRCDEVCIGSGQWAIVKVNKYLYLHFNVSGRRRKLVSGESAR